MKKDNLFATTLDIKNNSNRILSMQLELNMLWS